MMLQVLTANRGTMTPSEIAQWTLRERHDITTLVDRMEAEGLVRTKRHNKDKRSIDVTLTGKGRKVLNQATPAAREIVNMLMSSITEGDAILLEKFLRVLSQNAHHGLEYIAKVSQP
jgi:DNA-binding MarR family transcriptional regulator